jgi:prepilin-type N-terminal cleavage/methylation domain-containing protein
MKKLNGFTLAEIIVAMAISSLVVLSGLSIYYLTIKNSIDFSKSAKSRIHLLHFLSQMQDDVERSDRMVANGNKISFVFSETNTDYRFLDGLVIINSPQLSDTVAIPASGIRFSLDGQKTTVGLINEVTLTLYQYGTEKEYLIKKRYDAASYLRN